MISIIFLTLMLVLIVCLAIMAYRYRNRFTNLQREYKDACKLIDSISNAYYNQYGKAHTEK